MIQNIINSTIKNFCKCGCGSDIPFRDKKNRPVSYVKGHYVRTHPIPNRSKGENHYNWRGGRRINTQGYVMIRKPDHPRADANKEVREHILVMEAKLGRYLRKGEEVDHINQIKHDNRIENLRLMSSREHRIRHLKMRNFNH